VEVERLIGVYSDPTFQVFRYKGGNVVHYINTLFACRVVGGTLETCEESLDLQFFDPARLPEGMLLTHRIRAQDAVANRTTAFIR
jgi:hypothetical protein